MKIFTYVGKSINSGFYAGSLLIGDQDQEYFCKVSYLNTKSEQAASLMAIKRALIFRENNTPIYTIEGPYVYTQANFQDLRNDEICNHYIYLPAQVKSKPVTDKEKYFMQVIRTQVEIKLRNESLRNEISKSLKTNEI